MNYMAMAGWKTGDMLSGVEGIMNLAAASGEDLATTSDIVTDGKDGTGQGCKRRAEEDYRGNGIRHDNAEDVQSGLNRASGLITFWWWASFFDGVGNAIMILRRKSISRSCR